MLQANFGRGYASWLAQVGQRIDERPVEVHSEPRSMSRETTFEPDLHSKRDRPALSAVFTDLCVAVADDLRRKRYVGRTVGIKLRFDNSQTVTRDLTVTAPTSDPVEIRRAATACLKRVTLERKIRLLGVRGTASSRADEIQNELRLPVQGELPLL